MAANGVSNDVHEYGTVTDKQKSRVSCKYCSKVVSGFSRLKCHLGGIRGDVLPCDEVPEDVKVVMKNSVLERKRDTLSKEALQLFDSDISPKSNLCSSSADNHLDYTEPTISGKRKHMRMDSMPEEGEKPQVLFPHRKVESQTAAKNEEAEDDSSRLAQRCIGKFFFENGIDISAANSCSFQEMMYAVSQCGSIGHKPPNCYDLKGWILQEEIKDIQQYVEEVRHSWGSTGCSILLDGWTDEKGRKLINFLVDCPKGPIFLRSADISDSTRDVNTLIQLFDDVIEEVGVKNVVQIVTYTKLNCMEAVGKQLTDKHRTIFWTVCASHCIGLILEKIGMINDIQEILGKAKILTKFIYSHRTVLKLLRKHIHGRDLIHPSRIKSAMQFLTLENIMFEKENLENMFVSSAWNTSIWASRAEGRKVTELVGDPWFWTEAKMILSATIPLIKALHLISGGDNKPQVAYIYETMDQAKETIKTEFDDKKNKYIPFWKIIDDIWDNHLHSPVHSAGYFLNPSLFYATDFFADAEVASGLLCCIVRMIEDRRIQDLVVVQLEEYRGAKGTFGEETAVDQRTKVPPATWWSLYGGQCPELQRLAIRILSQQCCGALRFGMKRSLTEKLHTNGRNVVEQQRLTELTFVEHNLHLQLSLSDSSNGQSDIFLEEIDPMDDWVVEEVAEQNDSGMMDSECVDMNSTQRLAKENGGPTLQPKMEATHDHIN